MTTLLLLLAMQEAADHWPQWRGPRGDGTSATARPPLEWGPDRNVAWKVALPGHGSSTPVVWENKIFVLCAVDTGKPGPGGPAAPPAERGGRRMSGPPPSTVYRFEVLCLDRADGRILWRKTAVEEVPHEGVHATAGYASPSPATDGRTLIASFGSRGVFAYDLDGALLWKKDLGDLRIKNSFGEGISPALHAGLVVVVCDHEGDSFVVALDARTGEEKWRQSRDERTTWSTPLVVEHAGVTQAIVHGTTAVRSYELPTGKLLWSCGGQTGNVIPVPMAKDGVVYVMSGFRGNAMYAIRLDARGVVGDGPSIAWKRTDAAPYVASPVLLDGRIYFTKERQGVLSCVDAATGDLVFGPERLPGIDTIYASLAGADGKVYVTGRDGTTLVLKAGPAFEILATNRLGEGVDASPVLVGRQLLLRGAKNLYCFEAK
ncbi:MAG TPA: PQQ-binding-like beta-propeller repeat protein [Planctomycetota bacterium]|nr:PQQ-binding-like beta-propeller repeat protein [Planctomycetota bacterium]